jgi:uncharacterized protein involved in exopolysaccharide biosynthesis
MVARTTTAALLAVTGLAALGALATSACSRGEPRRYAVMGAIQLTPAAVVAVAGDASAAPVDLADEVLATEAEVVVSDRVLRQAVRAKDFMRDPALVGDAGSVERAVAALRASTTAHRRGKALILDVRVDLANPALARAACDAILEAYVRDRLDRRSETVETKVMWLSQQLYELEKNDAAAPVRSAVRDELARQDLVRLLRENDAWVLSECAPEQPPH